MVRRAGPAAAGRRNYLEIVRVMRSSESAVCPRPMSEAMFDNREKLEILGIFGPCRPQF